MSQRASLIRSTTLPAHQNQPRRPCARNGAAHQRSAKMTTSTHRHRLQPPTHVHSTFISTGPPIIKHRPHIIKQQPASHRIVAFEIRQKRTGHRGAGKFRRHCQPVKKVVKRTTHPRPRFKRHQRRSPTRTIMHALRRSAHTAQSIVAMGAFFQHQLFAELLSVRHNCSFQTNRVSTESWSNEEISKTKKNLVVRACDKSKLIIELKL
jgi:hypothetical protein